MVNAQEWLDEKHPKDGVYGGFPNISFHMFSDNRGKRREEIKVLDIWAASNLSGPLKLEGFDNLENFNCWYNSLTELDLQGAPNLKKVDCSSNNLSKLTLGSLKYLSYLNCSYNKLTELDTSNCPRLETLFCDGNQLRLNQENTDTAQNLRTELERERNKNKFLISQLEEKQSEPQN